MGAAMASSKAAIAERMVVAENMARYRAVSRQADDNVAQIRRGQTRDGACLAAARWASPGLLVVMMSHRAWLLSAHVACRAQPSSATLPRLFMQAFHGVGRELHGVPISMGTDKLVTRAESIKSAKSHSLR